jgi:hypothetical protein
MYCSCRVRTLHPLLERGIEEVAVETSRLKMLLVGEGMAALLVAASVVLGSVTDEADAARRTQLKTLWAVVNSDGTIDRGKGVASTRSSSRGT